ncbi:MAG: hypothetical protein QY324_14320 [Anaerolineales bacterium]|nr:MAG: hypothetical protein QY324_14320 [Anaerolineales bacterium]
MFHLRGLRRKLDGLARRDDRRRRLEKNQRDFRDLGAVFFGVFHVVASHANDLARRGRRQQADILEGNVGGQAFVRAEQVAFDAANFVAVQPAELRPFFPDLKTTNRIMSPSGGLLPASVPGNCPL